MKNRINLLIYFFAWSVGCLAQPAPHRADWMKGKYGIMVHWLTPWFGQLPPNAAVNPMPQRGEYISDLNAAVEGFNLGRFLRDFDQTGAEWLIFTIGQNHATYASPNSVIDSLCGPGHTAKRDLVLEIARAVRQRGKRFIAYLPVEMKAPANESLWRGMGWLNQPGTDQAVFQKNYLKAIREWSLRYGDLCDGWWFDGCYASDRNYFSNTRMKWEEWYAACRAGNPHAILAFNPGDMSNRENSRPIRPEHDYLAGEIVVLIDGKLRLAKINDDPSKLFMPSTAFVDGTNCLYHALPIVDANWAYTGKPRVFADWVNAPFKPYYPKGKRQMDPPLYPDEDLQRFVKEFTRVGGAVTLNVGIFQEGHLGRKTIAQVRKLKKAITSHEDH